MILKPIKASFEKPFILPKNTGLDTRMSKNLEHTSQSSEIK